MSLEEYIHKEETRHRRSESSDQLWRETPSNYDSAALEEKRLRAKRGGFVKMELNALPNIPQQPGCDGKAFDEQMVIPKVCPRIICDTGRTAAHWTSCGVGGATAEASYLPCEGMHHVRQSQANYFKDQIR